jgi:hypothetical protein
VIARIRGLFLRAALPSPSDMGRCFSTMSNILIWYVGRHLRVHNFRFIGTDWRVHPICL